MIKLSFTLQSKIVDFLLSLPCMHSNESQRAFIYRAGLDAKLQEQILFGQPPSQFVPLLVTLLVGYGNLEDGRNALEAVLEGTKHYVGYDREVDCEKLLQEIRTTKQEGSPLFKPTTIPYNNRRSALIHLHPDFSQELREVLKNWNKTQQEIEFVGLRPKHNLEITLLDKGAISDDEASAIAEQIRRQSGYPSSAGIIVFTEKRLYDEDYYQLFIGGREADENPPNIGILSLHFLRQLYSKTSAKTLMFRAIISNILFSIGIDAGLNAHEDEVKSCIMDFCYNMPDIQKGLKLGPKFCSQCTSLLSRNDKAYLLQLADSFVKTPNLESKDSDITETILFRDHAYEKKERFDYDITLSFSDKDRSYAEQLAEALRRLNINVFYDGFERVQLWGKNRQIYLTDLYRLRAKYSVILLSQNYKDSHWKNEELQTILSKALAANEDYILPIHLDDSEVPEILSNRGYISWHEETVASITQLIQEKLLDYQYVSTNYVMKE